MAARRTLWFDLFLRDNEPMDNGANSWWKSANLEPLGIWFWTATNTALLAGYHRRCSGRQPAEAPLDQWVEFQLTEPIVSFPGVASPSLEILMAGDAIGNGIGVRLSENLVQLIGRETDSGNYDAVASADFQVQGPGINMRLDLLYPEGNPLRPTAVFTHDTGEGGAHEEVLRYTLPFDVTLYGNVCSMLIERTNPTPGVVPQIANYFWGDYIGAPEVDEVNDESNSAHSLGAFSIRGNGFDDGATVAVSDGGERSHQLTVLQVINSSVIEVEPWDVHDTLLAHGTLQLTITTEEGWVDHEYTQLPAEGWQYVVGADIDTTYGLAQAGGVDGDLWEIVAQQGSTSVLLRTDTNFEIDPAVPNGYETVQWWFDAVDHQWDSGPVTINQDATVGAHWTGAFQPPAGVVGQDYSYDTSQHAAGDEPLTYSLAEGALPDTMTYSAAGLLSGYVEHEDQLADLVFRVENAGGLDDTDPVTIPFVPITLSSPRHANVADTSAQVGVTTNSPRDHIAWIADEDSTEPTPDQVAAGQNANGDPAQDAGSYPIAESGVQPLAGVVGLARGTRYYYWFAQSIGDPDDPEPLAYLSPVVGSEFVTTGEVAQPPTWVYTPPALSMGVVGIEYHEDQTGNVTGEPPITFDIEGDLPPGLAHTDGVIGGEPTEPGAWQFDWIAANAYGEDRWTTSITIGEIILSNPTTRNITQVSAEARVTTNGTAGSIFWGVNTDAAPPEAEDIVAGVGMESTGSFVPLTTGPQPWQLINSLDPNTTYYVWWTQGASGAYLAGVAGSAFTTAGTGAYWDEPFDLPGGVVGQPYSYDTSVHASGTPPLTFTTSTALPTGMTYSAAGMLSGTPELSFDDNVVMQVFNQWGGDSITERLVISSAPAAPVQIRQYQDRYVRNGIEVSIDLRTAYWSSNAGAVAVDLVGAPPPGMTWDAGTGVLSGTPTTDGQYGPLRIDATNDIGTTEGNEFYLNVVTVDWVTGHRTDLKYEALTQQGYTGDINSMTLAWLQDNGATSDSLPDAWAEVLALNGYDPVRNDSWFALLGDLGYFGAYPDRELAFWAAGGWIGSPLPPVDRDNVYQGFGAEYAVIERGEIDVIPGPWSVAFQIYVIEHTQQTRGIVVSGLNHPTQAPNQNWSVRIHTNDRFRIQCAGPDEAIYNLTPLPEVPTGRWLTVAGGYDGERLWLQFDGERYESDAFDYLPIYTGGRYMILGATSSSFCDELQLSSVVFTEGGDTFRGVYPLAEGEGLETLDYSINRNHMTLNSDIVHQTRLEDLVPPVIDTQPEDLEVDEPDGGTFSIVASHPQGADLFYLWQASDDGGSGWAPAETVFDDATGGSTDTLTLGSTLAGEDGYLVRCRVRAYDAADSNRQVFSDEVTLTVISAGLSHTITPAQWAVATSRGYRPAEGDGELDPLDLEGVPVTLIGAFVAGLDYIEIELEGGVTPYEDITLVFDGESYPLPGESGRYYVVGGAISSQLHSAFGAVLGEPTPIDIIPGDPMP